MKLKKILKKLKEMQADFERNLRIERQKSESQRKAHEKAVDALQKNINSINDLKDEYKEFIEYKHLFPKNLMIFLGN
jgi:flagellar hook-associated protein FlgK